jgi:beta-glucanase (GH16 family)
MRGRRAGAGLVAAMALAALAAACGGSKSATTTPTITPSSGHTNRPFAAIPGLWKPVFADNFSGTSLNTSKWQPGWFGSGVTVSPNTNDDDLACESPTQVTVSGGELHITAKRANITCAANGVSYNRNYEAGIVSSNPVALGAGKGFQFTHGLIEFRAKIPSDGHGLCADWPSLWTDGHPPWPVDGELDAYECLKGGGFSYLHVGPDPAHNLAGGGAVDGNWTGWHTFAIDWEPTTATTYFDGRKVESSPYVQSHPNFIVISLGVRSLGTRVVLPTTLDVDWVKVWQHSTASSARPITASAAGLELAAS